MAADDAAVTVTLRAELKGYEAALKQAVRQTERAAAAAEKALAGVGKTNTGNVIQANFAKSADAIANDARVLQFQLNDIFSGIASGQGIRAVQQQLGQIAQQMSGGSLAQGARTFSTALIGMVNPINLAIAGFGILATVAANYFSEASDGSEESAAELKKHRDLIADVAKAYGDALPALKAFNDYLDQQEGKAKQISGLQEAVKQANEALKTSLQNAGLAGIDKVLGIFKGFEKLNLQPVIDQWEAYKKHVADGTVTVEEHQAMAEVLNRTLNSLPVGKAGSLAAEFNKALEPITKLIQQVQNLNKELKSTSDNVADVINQAVPLPDIGPPVTSGAGVFNPSQTQLENAAKEILKQRAQGNEHLIQAIDQLDDDFAERLMKLLQEFPNAKIASAFRTFEEQKRIWDSGIRPAARPGHSRHEKGAAVDVSGLSVDDLRQLEAAATKFGLQTGRSFGDPGHIQQVGEAIDRVATATEHSSTAYDDLVTSINAKTEAQQRENEINNDYTLSVDQKTAALQKEKAAQEAARVEQELNNAAQAQGIPLTDDLKAKNHALAESYAAAGLKADQLSAAQQRAAKSTAEAKQLTDQINQQFAGIIGGGLSSFVQDLINGEDAGEAFSNMLKRMAGQIADMAVQLLIIKPLMNSLFGGVGGGFGAGMFEGGGTVGMSGRHDGRKFAPALWAGAPRYAQGGMVGLRPGEVPIIAHKGEIVIPNARRLAGRSSGSGETIHIRLQDDSGRMADIADRRIRTASGAIVRVSVQQSSKAIEKQMPGLMTNAQARSL